MYKTHFYLKREYYFVFLSIVHAKLYLVHNTCSRFSTWLKMATRHSTSFGMTFYLSLAEKKKKNRPEKLSITNLFIFMTSGA